MPFEKVREELTLIYEDYAEDVGTQGKPGSEFALEEELTTLRARDTEGTSDFAGPHSPGGFIPICYQGCEYVLVMVTSGSLAGSVFHHDGTSRPLGAGGPRGPEPPGIVASQRPFRSSAGVSGVADFAEWIDGWAGTMPGRLRGDPAAT